MRAQRPRLPLLAAYDRAGATELLRGWTAQGLRDALRGGRFGAALTAADREELDALLTAWIQRALGGVFLRDALAVDGRRGARVFGLICAGMTRAYAPMPPDLAAQLRSRGPGDLPPAGLADLAPRDPALARLAELACREGLCLALVERPAAYPPIDEPDSLAPAPVPAHTFHGESFAPPSGPRRNIAISLAVGGMALMIVPMLGGAIPQHPAGLPLALITLALLIGIRAGRAGLLGSLFLWLVPNLPGFRHGTEPPALLPALPLVIAGLALLALDRRIRAMWVWICRQLGL